MLLEKHCHKQCFFYGIVLCMDLIICTKAVLLKEDIPEKLNDAITEEVDTRMKYYLNAFNGALGGLILPVSWALDILY